MSRSPASFSIRIAPWDEIGEGVRAVREAVFIVEQKIPAEMEWDDIDAECAQALATNEAGVPVGTGRLLPNGYIGRVAVLASHRSLGVGRAIIDILIGEARRRCYAEVALNAQTQAAPFYQKSGFTVAGDEFMEAGIPHVLMKQRL
jgi:predicted GNAT family N-acyltransferase